MEFFETRQISKIEVVQFTAYISRILINMNFKIFTKIL